VITLLLHHPAGFIMVDFLAELVSFFASPPLLQPNLISDLDRNRIQSARSIDDTGSQDNDVAERLKKTRQEWNSYTVPPAASTSSSHSNNFDRQNDDKDVEIFTTSTSKISSSSFSSSQIHFQFELKDARLMLVENV
jgi:hypothetical protein